MKNSQPESYIMKTGKTGFFGGKIMEEMNELFYRFPYERKFNARVKKCRKSEKGYEVILEDTGFYPEGGGQPADRGMIDGKNVLDVQRKEGQIVHLLSEPVEEGKEVEGVIDWDFRFDNMQNHTGEHIVSGLIHQKFGYDNVGFHMGSEVIQIDFNGPLTWEDLMEAERKANEIVMTDEPVHIFFPERDELGNYDYRSKKELKGRVRLVEIEGADLCACCGTHVSHTGEIGLIKILSLMKYKNGVRVEMLSGRRAVSCVQEIVTGNRKAMTLLSCRQNEVSEAVEHLKEENSGLVSRIREMHAELTDYRVSSFPENSRYLIDFEDDMDRISMTHMGNAMLEKRNAGIAAVLSRNADTYAYFICSKKTDLSRLAKELNQKLNGRGGGRADNIQGQFRAEKDEILHTLQEVFEKL